MQAAARSPRSPSQAARRCWKRAPVLFRSVGGASCGGAPGMQEVADRVLALLESTPLIGPRQDAFCVLKISSAADIKDWQLDMLANILLMMGVKEDVAFEISNEEAIQICTTSHLIDCIALNPLAKSLESSSFAVGKLMVGLLKFITKLDDETSIIFFLNLKTLYSWFCANQALLAK
uniref:Acyl carrier protein 2, mitochondrial n=1 Tax=Anthurium amnicola TaxID=1678845 RepID=A0A1D1ZAA2_9ARAE